MDGIPILSATPCVRTQFPMVPSLKADTIEELLVQKSLSKPLSTLYLALLKVDSPKMEALWEKWRVDIPSLDRETWEDCLENRSKLVISSRDKLIQTEFLHRIYYMPQRLHKIYPQCSQNCPWCKSSDSTYIHMLWACPKLTQYWAAIMEHINTRLQLDIPLMAELALLGIQDDEQRPRYTRLLISFLLFYAKKEILLKWAFPSARTVRAWETPVNTVLPMFKLTYTNRGCPQKFEQIWQPWTKPT